MTRVHSTFGTSGKAVATASSGGYRSQVRTYKGCGSAYNTVSVSYSATPHHAYTLAAKAAVWVG